MSNSKAGVLYVVATPIGNLEDITLRARRLLGEVSVVAAEDTRHSGRLLGSLGLSKPMVSLHEHNEARAAEGLVQKLRGGEDVALVSDAGTPLISDPGYQLVRACQQSGIKVEPVPGPSALIAALSVSGLPTDRFTFVGFLPRSSAKRRDSLTAYKDRSETLVFYESPHRLLDALVDMEAVFGGNREAVLARELTKIHETLIRAPLDQLRKRVEQDREQQLGEIVLLVAGRSEEKSVSAEDLDHTLEVLLSYLPVKDAAAAAARLTGGRKNSLYQRALEILGRREEF